MVFAIIALSNSLTLQHEDRYEITSVPSNENLVTPTIYLELSDDRLTFHGCNYNSAFVERLDEDRVTIGGWISTLMACEHDVDHQIVRLLIKTDKIDEEDR